MERIGRQDIESEAITNLLGEKDEIKVSVSTIT